MEAFEATVSQEISRISAPTVDAEIVETETKIRRAPEQGTKISMQLEKWLEVDHKLNELFTLCEVAITQRDSARNYASKVERAQTVTAQRLAEWKAYADKLEQHMHALRTEVVELQQRFHRAQDMAEEAVELPLMAVTRRKRLRQKIRRL